MAKGVIELDGAALNRARLQRGLSREALASRAGVSPNRVRLVLAGGPVGLRAASAVVRALGLRFADVVRLGGGGPVPAQEESPEIEEPAPDSEVAPVVAAVS
jgi:transcriptional regulator with XRE-family HTH domain